MNERKMDLNEPERACNRTFCLSEGGMIRLETLIELKSLDSSFYELVLLLKFDKQLPVERFEAAVSQSAVPSPPLINAMLISPPHV